MSTKVYVLAGVLSVILSVALCLGLTLFFVNFSPKEIKNNLIVPNDPIVATPAISAPNSLTIELLDSFSFSYTITNLGTFESLVEVEDESVITLEDGIIKPKKIGVTKIIITVNCSPVITKETTIEVVDCVREVTFSLTDLAFKPVTTFYTNTEYLIQLKQNIIENQTPNLVGENVSKLELIGTDGGYTFKFKVLSAGKFSFVYNGKYVSLEEEYYAYAYPSDFSVSFINMEITGNNIMLHLFNDEYMQEANADGMFITTKYCISKDQVDNVILLDNYDKNILDISGETITAKSVGQTTIAFYSTITQTTKEYIVTVDEILPTGIIINGVLTPLNKTNTVELTDLSYEFAYSIYPIYSLGDLSLQFDQEKVIYQNNVITLKENQAEISIFLSGEKVYTLNLIKKEEIQYSIEILSSTNNSLLEDKTLKTTINTYIQLQIIAKQEGVVLDNQEYEIEILNPQICQWLDTKIVNGKLSIKAITQGSTIITVYDVTNNQTFSIIVVVE